MIYLLYFILVLYNINTLNASPNTGAISITKVPSLNQLGGAARMPPAEAVPFHHKQYYQKKAREQHFKQLRKINILKERRMKAKPTLSNEVLKAESELNNAVTHHAPYHATKPTTSFNRFAQIHASEEHVKNENVNLHVEARAKRKMRREMPMKLRQQQYARQRFSQVKYADEARNKYNRANQIQEHRAKYNLQHHEMLNRIAEQHQQPTPVRAHQYDTHHHITTPVNNNNNYNNNNVKARAKHMIDSEVYRLQGRLAEARDLERRFFGK